MKRAMRSLAKLGLLSLLMSPVGPTFAQQDIAKSLVERLTARIARLESACAKDIKKYCKTVTPGEGRTMYCMLAHEDKISPQCDYELGEAASGAQASLDSLKDAIIACKAEIAGVCGKTVPGQGRIAACLMANKSAASNDCVNAIQKIETLATQ